MTLPSGTSISERAAALRDLGMFADRADLSDAELGSAVADGMAETWGDIPADEPLLELLVAEQDTDRVWWRDLEADAAEGNEVYATTLDEWAAISMGTFKPSSIDETWRSDVGPVIVTFELDGRSHVLRPEYLDDWIDPRIATPINESIADSGRAFTFVKAFDQTAVVVALTVDERAALEHRGWCFD